VNFPTATSFLSLLRTDVKTVQDGTGG